MSKMNIKRKSWIKKKRRTKKALGVLGKYPRLIVFKSNKHFYSQVLDDNNSTTVCSSSSNNKSLLKAKQKGLSKTDISKEVGYDIAKKISDKKMSQVLFDRNGYKFHGRIKAFVEAVKEKGIKI
jgi:large subunit ribosomal protein L18